MPKTTEELQQENNELEGEIKLRRVLDVERERSDEKYALKIYEKAMIGIITLILAAVFAAILKNTLGL